MTSKEWEEQAEAGLCPTCHGNTVIAVRETGGMVIGTSGCPTCNGSGRTRPASAEEVEEVSHG